MASQVQGDVFQVRPIRGEKRTYRSRHRSEPDRCPDNDHVVVLRMVSHRQEPRGSDQGGVEARPQVAERAVSIVAASFQQRLVTATGVRMTLDRMPRARRRGLVGALLEDLVGGVGSLPEAQFLQICRKAGFPSRSTPFTSRSTAASTARSSPGGRT